MKDKHRTDPAATRKHAPRYTRALDQREKQRLDTLYAYLSKTQGHHAGYPCNQLFDYSELYRFLEFSINNVGDPFHDTNFRLNTHDFEREMIHAFARLTNAPGEDYWGYINNGGTEGNLYGLYLARELMRDGIAYFSEDTHYSVAKILRVLNLRHIMIKSCANGAIDLGDLRESIRIHRDVPPIVIANVGTTMTGAIDDVTEIRGIFDKFAISRAYVHCDAALSGMILPFLDDPPPFGFEAGIDSIAISGHKLIGSPIPCGVVLAKREHVNLIARGIEYVGALDTTITGSRNAFTPLILWYAFRRYGEEGLRGIIRGALELADYAIERFKRRGIEAWRNPHSITVVFPRPSDAVVRKWQLAAKGNIAHVVTLPHLDRAKINRLVDDACGGVGPDLDRNVVPATDPGNNPGTEKDRP